MKINYTCVSPSSIKIQDSLITLKGALMPTVCLLFRAVVDEFKEVNGIQETISVSVLHHRHSSSLEQTC